MQKSLAAIGAGLALCAAAVSVPALASSSNSALAPVAPLQTAVPVRAQERREAHPEIRRAITALESAKKDLQRANHDFGGHRVDALAACDKAIYQLKLALQYDKR
ncbi:MAG TPA: hypothetical protein VE110_04425 [Gemmatimonadaceae bacterium]|jgi:hypothetical protein|nr:hypothetical protein [Gemmatimonadaceae bacterium]